METYKYVIIGGGMAGGRACESIRKADAQGSLALIAAEPQRPYQRPPLSKGYLLGTEGLDHVYLKDETFYADNKVQLLTGARALKIERGMHQVSLDNGQMIGYEKLLLATGGSARRLAIPGSDLAGVYTLRTIADADRIRAAARTARHAVVIGGSFIGCEVASSLAQLDVQVSMVFMEERLLERVCPESLSRHIEGMYAAHGVRLLPQSKPSRMDGDGRVSALPLENGERLPADLVIMGVGITLHTELARDAGLEMTDAGAVVVDEFLRTSDPDIYAAGDIAAWPDPTFGERLRVEHWDVARQQGTAAGRNMTGEAKPYTALPYFYSDLFDLSFEVWGNLGAWDQTALRGSLEERSFAFYYFSQGRMVGVLAAGRPDGERKPMQALVKARPFYDGVASLLADGAVELKSLMV
jgi:3-phenylpropionate/trans-cinnamate dioxygenase ferredoxin reductase subunit